MSNINMQAAAALDELSDAELDQVLGAGNGVFYTFTHECNTNSFYVAFTCCS
ncbi:lantibiotic lacticin [Actinomyces naeslundii]|uniref:lacticin 481 family lantibiotic n=1 Tax=Actinomyces naeslundii TaxID=1655 RepID=UPI00096F858D|nr:lacticin 481 family lantibiotic [Actinomyces naeslundii]OMG12922.1 lantibiotic lacticin [Actinomyces naeslundii]